MTPDIKRLIIFLFVLIAIQGGVDFYLFRTIKKYEAFYGAWFSKVLILYKHTAFIMLIVLFLTTIERLLLGNNLLTGRGAQIAIALWYLPKYPIALILSIYKVIKVIVTFIQSRITSDKLQVSSIDEKRRKVIHSIGVSIASIPFISTAQGVFHTIYDIEIRTLELIIPRLSLVFDGYKIIQISDIHTGSLFGTTYIEEVVQSINQMSPDIIAITGDYVNFDPQEYAAFVPLFSQLQAKHGVYGSLGNHDHYMTEDKHEYLLSLIRKSKVDLLINESRTIVVNGSKLVIAGTDNTGFNQRFGDLDKTFINIPKDVPVILMSHDPTYWDMQIAESQLADLTLSGHTHGGQIGIEYLGSSYSPAQFVYQHWSGLYKSNGNYLYVNRGIGTVGPPIRIGIRPEITLITLRAPVA